MIQRRCPAVRGHCYANGMSLQTVIAAITLWWRALHQPDVDPADVTTAWVAAEIEQTQRVDASLLMAIMWHESRYQPSAGPACGVMQVYPHDIYLDDATSCRAWRTDVRAGVHAGVVEIEMMLAEKRVGGDLHTALMYRACGGRAFIPGACTMAGWVNKVLERRAMLDDRYRTTM